MQIKEPPFRHWLDHFYGYGSWEAQFWFIGFEETGGDLPEEVAEKLNYFFDVHRDASTPTLCDARALYKHAKFRVDGPRAEKFETMYDHRFGKQAVIHGIWKNLIAYVHGFENKVVPELLKYQQDEFVSPSAHSEALITLYPLPSPHNHAWYYSWLDMPQFGFLKSRAQYEQHLFPGRIKTILEKIKTHQPKAVLMYDMSNINELKNAVIEVFPKAKFKMEKAIKLVIPQHHIADVNGTKLVITTQSPALRHNRIETGFDWEELGKRNRACC